MRFKDYLAEASTPRDHAQVIRNYTNTITKKLAKIDSEASKSDSGLLKSIASAVESKDFTKAYSLYQKLNMKTKEDFPGKTFDYISDMGT